MIKVGDYVDAGRRPMPKCDSCNENDATKKIYAERNGEYIVGIRVCDDCFEEFKESVI